MTKVLTEADAKADLEGTPRPKLEGDPKDVKAVEKQAKEKAKVKRAEISYTGAGYLIATLTGEQESSGVVQSLATAILEAVRLDKEGYEVRATVDQNGNFDVVRFGEE